MIQFLTDSVNWLATWWILFLLLELLTIFSSFASSYYEFTSRTLDEKYPDNLEQTAAEWVKERIEKSNREIKVSKISEVFFRSLSAYHPSKRMIILSDETWSKNDPTFWAVAAHELGHAKVYQSHPIWAAINLFARRALKWIKASGPVLLLANTFYRDPLATTIIYSLLACGVGAGVLVLIDEVWASKLALLTMSDDDQVESAWLPDIKHGLRAAFLTYLASVGGLVVLTASYPFLAPMFSTGFEVVTLSSSEIFTVDILACIVGFLAINFWSKRRFFYEFFGEKREIDKVDSTQADSMLKGCGKFAFSVLLSLIQAILLYAMLLMIWNSNSSPIFITVVFVASLAVYGPFVLQFLPLSLFIRFPFARVRKALWPPPPKEKTAIKFGDSFNMKNEDFFEAWGDSEEGKKDNKTNKDIEAHNSALHPKTETSIDRDRTAILPNWNWTKQLKPGFLGWVLPVIIYWVYFRLVA